VEKRVLQKVVFPNFVNLKFLDNEYPVQIHLKICQRITEPFGHTSKHNSESSTAFGNNFVPRKKKLVYPPETATKLARKRGGTRTFDSADWRCQQRAQQKALYELYIIWNLWENT
jgi:hypothetical protein